MKLKRVAILAAVSAIAIILLVYLYPLPQASPQVITSWTDSITVGPTHPQVVSGVGYYFEYPTDNYSIAAIGYRATDGMMSTSVYAVHNLTFAVKFVGDSGSPLATNEMVVLMTNNTSTWQGYEAGLRYRLNDGQICLYGQFPSPTGGVVFQEYAVMLNDAQWHTWSILNNGLEITLYRDGKPVWLMLQPTVYVLDSHIVAQCVRWDSGWPSVGWGFYLTNVTVS